jgi:hypothetical protein
MLIFFVAEDPFGVNDVLVLGEGAVVQLFLHCQQLIWILECFLYTYELNKGDKRVMFNK